jgi:hypothetical protein
MTLRMELIVLTFLKKLRQISVLSILSFKARYGLKKRLSKETDRTLGVTLTISIYIFLLLMLAGTILLPGFHG